MNEKRITVFTPTYNRAYTLERLYNSLKCQTIKDFVWLVIDDGSSDGTKELVQTWINKGNNFEIRYYYKKNGGMHTAHNLAFEKCTTELVFCLDSDDDLTNDAIEKILNIWDNTKKSEKIIGIVANEQYRTTKKVIGTELPRDVENLRFYEIYNKYNVKGDKVLIYLTKIIRENPYPKFEGERFVPLGIKYLKLDGQLIVLNQSIMNKEYLEDGYTKNILKAYVKNPRGFAYEKHEKLKLFSFSKNPIVVAKAAMHYVATNMLIGNKKFISESPKKIITIICLLPGLLRYMQLKKVSNSL